MADGMSWRGLRGGALGALLASVVSSSAQVARADDDVGPYLRLAPEIGHAQWPGTYDLQLTQPGVGVLIDGSSAIEEQSMSYGFQVQLGATLGAGSDMGVKPRLSFSWATLPDTPDEIAGTDLRLDADARWRALFVGADFLFARHRGYFGFDIGAVWPGATGGVLIGEGQATFDHPLEESLAMRLGVGVRFPVGEGLWVGAGPAVEFTLPEFLGTYTRRYTFAVFVDIDPATKRDRDRAARSRGPRVAAHAGRAQ